MTSYEYTVIPAPNRGEKAKGAKTGIERFAVALSGALNEMAEDGWEYVRAETLPSEERTGLTGRTTVYHNILVFRRALESAEQAPAPAPVMAAPEPQEDLTDLPAMAEPEEPAVRAPFSQPMRSMPRPVRAPDAEPPLTAPELSPETAPGPRLGPAR